MKILVMYADHKDFHKLLPLVSTLSENNDVQVISMYESILGRTYDLAFVSVSMPSDAIDIVVRVRSNLTYVVS